MAARYTCVALYLRSRHSGHTTSKVHYLLRMFSLSMKKRHIGVLRLWPLVLDYRGLLWLCYHDIMVVKISGLRGTHACTHTGRGGGGRRPLLPPPKCQKWNINFPSENVLKRKGKSHTQPTSCVGHWKPKETGWESFKVRGPQIIFLPPPSPQEINKQITSHTHVSLGLAAADKSKSQCKHHLRELNLLVSSHLLWTTVIR